MLAFAVFADKRARGGGDVQLVPPQPLTTETVGTGGGSPRVPHFSLSLESHGSAFPRRSLNVKLLFHHPVRANHVSSDLRVPGSLPPRYRARYRCSGAVGCG